MVQSIRELVKDKRIVFVGNSVEIMKIHCDMLDNNIKQYKLSKTVKIYCNDYLNIMMDLKQDVIFFDPPWGGKNYKSIKYLNLYLDNVDIVDITNKLKDNSKLIILRVPKNFNFNRFNLKSHFSKIDVHPLYHKNTKIIRFFVIALQK